MTFKDEMSALNETGVGLCDPIDHHDDISIRRANNVHRMRNTLTMINNFGLGAGLQAIVRYSLPRNEDTDQAEYWRHTRFPCSIPHVTRSKHKCALQWGMLHRVT